MHRNAHSQAAPPHAPAAAAGCGRAGSEHRTDDVVCVTLYNEPLASLLSTLSSIFLSALHAQAGRRLQTLTVCILADGGPREAPEVASYLLPRLDPGWQYFPREDCVVHAARRPVRCWLEGDVPAALQDHGDWPVRLEFCRKAVNRGKLDSHALFFSVLCPPAAPRRTWQVDAGTTLAPDTFTEVIDRFDADARVGAVGARIEIAPPRDGDGFVRRWQYMDFAVQLASFWPAEVFSGHMSVLPGQCCALRWDALVAGAEASPLSRYLRGLEPASRMERVMFLAEDRVIGNEMALAPGRPWRLDYAPRAGAVTDACEDFAELLRQRRRWHNSSFACRLWLLWRCPAQVARADLGAARRARFATACAWQAFVAALQLLQPALALSGWSVLVLSMVQLWQQGLAALVIATVGLFALAAMLGRDGAGRCSGRRAVWRDACAAGALGLQFATLSTALSVPVALAVAGPPMLLAVVPALALPGSRLARLRHAPEYVLFNGFVQLRLWCYALVHLADTSWGTKDLRHSGAADRNAGAYERTVRRCSLVANGGLLLASGWSWSWMGPLNLGALAGAAAALLLCGCGVAGLAALWWRERLRLQPAGGCTAVQASRPVQAPLA